MSTSTTTPMNDAPDLRQIRRAADLVLYSSTAVRSETIKQFTRLKQSRELLSKLR